MKYVHNKGSAWCSKHPMSVQSEWSMGDSNVLLYQDIIHWRFIVQTRLPMVCIMVINPLNLSNTQVLVVISQLRFINGSRYGSSRF